MRRLPWLLFLVAAGACQSAPAHSPTGKPTATALKGDTARGETVYANSCGSSSCHGADGVGPAPSLPDELSHHGDGFFARVILEGDGDMPPQSELTDQEVADVIAYMRQRWE